MLHRKRRSDAKSIVGQTKIIEEEIETNDNTTVPIGPLALTKMSFEFLELDKVLSPLKRRQGTNVTDPTVALISKSMSSIGLSINRMEDIIEDNVQRETYGLSDDADINDFIAYVGF